MLGNVYVRIHASSVSERAVPPPACTASSESTNAGVEISSLPSASRTLGTVRVSATSCPVAESSPDAAIWATAGTDSPDQ